MKRCNAVALIGFNLALLGFGVAQSSNQSGETAISAASVNNSGSENIKGSFVQTAGGAADMEINHVLTSTAPNGPFPLGGDIAVSCRGPADCWVAHTAAKTTTASTLAAGVNTSVAVSHTSPTNSLLTSFTDCNNAGIVVGRGTPNEEQIAHCKIVDATHITLTCAKNHTINGPDNNNKPLIDVEQGQGNSVFQMDGGGTITFGSVSPSQQPAGVHEMVRVTGTDGIPYMLFPSSQADNFPRSAVAFRAPLTGTGTIGAGGGQLPSGGDLVLRNAMPDSRVVFQSSDGKSSFLGSDSSLTFVLPLTESLAGGTPARSGSLRFRNVAGIAWRNGANTGDLSFGVNPADGPAFNTAAVKGTIPYNVGVADLTQQGVEIGPTTIRTVAPNQAGLYRISWCAKITTPASTSSTLGGFQIVYTDADDSQTVTTPAGAATTGNTAQTQVSGVVVVNAKASTNIQYKFGYTSSGTVAMKYSLHVRVEPI